MPIYTYAERPRTSVGKGLDRGLADVKRASVSRHIAVPTCATRAPRDRSRKHLDDVCLRTPRAPHLGWSQRARRHDSRVFVGSRGERGETRPPRRSLWLEAPDVADRRRAHGIRRDGRGPASTPPASPASTGSDAGPEVTSLGPCGPIVGTPGMDVPSGPSMIGPPVPGMDGVTLSPPGSVDVGVGTPIGTSLDSPGSELASERLGTEAGVPVPCPT